MKATMTKSKTSLPWGVEIELVTGRCLYIGAKNIIASIDEVEIVVNETNSITLPRAAVRKIMIMVADDDKEPGDESDS